MLKYNYITNVKHLPSVVITRQLGLSTLVLLSNECFKIILNYKLNICVFSQLVTALMLDNMQNNMIQCLFSVSSPRTIDALTIL